MALNAGNVYQILDNATASNVNGGGFNTANANFLTDFTTDANTANTAAPILSSASYNFVAGDVGAYAYVKAGTNAYPDAWYPIVSVASNKATLDATIGVGVIKDTVTGLYKPTTVVGIASVGTPTNLTIGFDFCQQTAAEVASTDLASVTGSLVVTSVAGGFRRIMTGNILHIVSGTNDLAGWYEVVNFTDANTVTVDRECTTGTNMSVGVGNTGGAARFGALDDAFLEAAIPGNFYYMKSGNHALGGAIALSADATLASRIRIIGFNAVRGDNPSGSNRPSLNQSTFAFALGAYWDAFYITTMGTATTTFSSGAGSVLLDNRFRNESTTATRVALGLTSGQAINCEAVSLRGYATSGSGSTVYRKCYFHDSDIGVRRSNADSVGVGVINNIFSGNITANVLFSGTATGAAVISGNTIYGAENKLGIGISFGTMTNPNADNNIFYGLATGISASAAATGYSDYNDYFNNTADVSNFTKGANDKALNPQFTSVSQITGTAGAFAAGGSKIIDTTKNFTTLGVVAGNYVYITAGTGIPSPSFPYLIDSISTTTNANDTLNITKPASPGTDTTADKSYQITIGFNWGIGTNLKAAGYPGTYDTTSTISYLDIGAVQREEQGSGGSGGFFIS